MTKNKIQGKFYPLTPEMGRKLRKAGLTKSEWRIWSYLVGLDPYGDRYYDLDTMAAMEECQVSKTTLWRAMCKFQDIGLFDFQDKGFYFKNETGVSKLKQEFQICNENFKNETDISKLKRTEPETLTQQELIFPKRSKTNKTFSEATERERFVKFCKRKADELPVKVVLLQSWVEKNFEELLEMYKEATGQAEVQEEGKRSAGVDSDRELINQALESGEIEDYDMGCKSVRYPGTKWWTDVEEFLTAKRAQQSSATPEETEGKSKGESG